MRGSTGLCATVRVDEDPQQLVFGYCDSTIIYIDADIPALAHDRVRWNGGDDLTASDTFVVDAWTAWVSRLSIEADVLASFAPAAHRSGLR